MARASSRLNGWVMIWEWGWVMVEWMYAFCAMLLMFIGLALFRLVMPPDLANSVRKLDRLFALVAGLCVALPKSWIDIGPAMPRGVLSTTVINSRSSTKTKFSG